MDTLFDFFYLQVQAEIDELEMVVLEQQDKLTIREKLRYMTSRAVQMPLGITLVLFAFQVKGHLFCDILLHFLAPSSGGLPYRAFIF